MSTVADADRVEDLARRVVADHDPKTVPIPEFLGACYDAGLSWIHFPEGLGGLGLSRGLQAVADRILQGAGGPVPLGLNPMGYGMAAPTVREHAQSDDLKKALLRPLATTEDIWCQLFSEPGAGSDLAGLATTAVPDGDEWVINGQKVWTSLAHRARWGLLLARTNPDIAKHKGLTYFVLDMHAPGVETRPLRQMTGQAEFNEVYMTDVRIPDSHRLGAVGNGWGVAMTTLMNERSALGASGSRRGSGTIKDATTLWASRPDLHTPILRDRLAQLWLRSEAQRLTSERSRASATAGGPGPEASVGKLVGAELNQHIYQWCMDLLGPEGTLYNGYSMSDASGDAGGWRGPIQQRFLRSRANTIEGGTSEVMRNILGERVLGLPGDLRADAGMPWKEIPRG
ncbi:acyl-CoA dehydrogenase family protein [Mycolicibacterium sphagni]|uniref:Acyl-CoA dehydrogenase n=1 Tax=Mycolicibacterium sphagni TaxID=1786 RepID=A0A255DFQ6_9MYCO|nr:acyl-CoA dehydrogenase family protein [Mycolicibacterium sphagni]MCV7180174.1 acyl-CoA dehydrogenase family protein [Mycolicibacterium sphagni]OYN75782.1 acyl-CoA dehydrogenase [Mycolicibacterium sphagni]